MPAEFVQVGVVCAWTPAFLLEVWTVCVCWMEGVYVTGPQFKPSELALVSLPDSISRVLAQLIGRGIVSYGLDWEETLESFHLASPRLCPSPVSPPNESITFQRCLCLYPVGTYCTHCSTSCFSHIKCFEDSLHQHSWISILSMPAQYIIVCM